MDKVAVATVANAALNAVRKIGASDALADMDEESRTGLLVAGLVMALEGAYYSKYPDTGLDSIMEAIALCRAGRLVAVAVRKPDVITSFPKL